jgi:hypothetical protein
MNAGLREFAHKLAYRRNGFDCVLVEALGPAAIFEQRQKNVLFAYEVVLARLRKPHWRVALRTRKPANGELVVRYPPDADWGRHGWTYSLYGGTVPQAEALSRARAKMHAVAAAQGERKARRAAREVRP